MAETNSIIQKIKKHKAGLIQDELLKKSAVMICLLENGDDYDILFEVRASDVPSQPGDICFPGGGLKEGETFDECAIRETCEELEIAPEQIELIAPFDALYNWTLYMKPFVCILKEYQNTFSKKEVAEVFRVPLKFFLETEPESWVVHGNVLPPEDFPFERIVGGENYRWHDRRSTTYFYQYQDRVIWGLTACIVHAFCEMVEE